MSMHEHDGLAGLAAREAGHHAAGGAMTDAELTEARLSAWRDAERENTELHAKIARLRAENKRLRGEAGGMEMEIFDLRAQMEQLGADMAELERLRAEVSLLQQEARIRQAINDGLAAEVAAERAAVVAWLHTEADKFDGEGSDVLQTMFRCGACMSLINAADDIERGEHRKK